MDNLYSVKPEPEEKPQNLTEKIDDKKHKKPKKTLNTHTSITGFEKAFEQFATASVQTSQDKMDIGSEVGGPLSPKQTEPPQTNQLDLSPTQVCIVKYPAQQHRVFRQLDKTSVCVLRSLYCNQFINLFLSDVLLQDKNAHGGKKESSPSPQQATNALPLVHPKAGPSS